MNPHNDPYLAAFIRDMQLTPLEEMALAFVVIYVMDCTSSDFWQTSYFIGCTLPDGQRLYREYIKWLTSLSESDAS